MSVIIDLHSAECVCLYCRFHVWAQKNKNKFENVKVSYYIDVVIKSLVSAWFPEFLEKKRLNACGFAWEFFRSGMLYRPGQSLKRHNKSSSLHSKKIFCLGDAGFL